MTTAKQRLEQYRKTAAKYNTTWRTQRYPQPFAYGPTYGWQSDGVTLWADHNHVLGKFEGDAGELTRLGHTGWFCDNDQREVCRGAVIKLRCSRGTYYIAMTYMSDSDQACIHMDSKILVPKTSDEDEHRYALRQVAQWADQHAERRAELCREDDLQHLVDTRIEDLQEENKLATEKVRSLIGAVRESSSIHPTLCSHLKESIRKLLGLRRSNFEMIAQYREDPHSAIY